MRLVITGKPGRIFYAKGHPDFLKIRPLYCFVPDELHPADYEHSCWPSVNTGANPHAIGSHLFPDWNRPVRDPNCPALQPFLGNLPRFIARAK